MESWFLISIGGYSLLAIEAVITKILLTNRIKSWQLYSFFVGLLSLSSLLFVFSGLKWFGWFLFAQSLLTGLIFFLALIFLYKSLEQSSASRVFVLYGAMITLGSFVLGHFLLGERFLAINVLGVFFLLIGGFFISYKIHEKRLFSTYKNVILSGLLMAVALIMMKDLFDRQNFVTGYIFSRLGVFISAMGMLFFPQVRRVVKKSFSKENKKSSQKNAVLVLGSKIVAGIGSIMVNYSISLGSVALVSALVSVQYLLTFIFTVILSIFFQSLIKEKATWQNISFKLIGTAFIIIGMSFIK